MSATGRDVANAGDHAGLTARLAHYNALMDYLYAALLLAFIVAVLIVLWKREHPRKN